MFVKHPILIMLQEALTPVTMTFFYGSTIILLFHYKKATRLLTYMANMGKMSVSNYLAQSIIATTIFMHMDLAYTEKLAISLAFF